jgi:hypothetical protein
VPWPPASGPLLPRLPEVGAVARRIAEAEIIPAKAEAQAKDLLIAELRRPWWRRLIG